MSLAVTLLGRPEIVSGDEPVYRFRSRKSWALLAFLLLSERPPSRARLSELLFSDAADPLGALRWNLAEVRRALGAHGTLEGDPVVLDLAADVVVDAVVLARGTWVEAVDLPGLGSVLLEGVNVRGAAGFESWLAVEQQRFAATSEAVLHEAAQALMARGELSEALACARRVVDMTPLDENNQALLVRLLRLVGDEASARRQAAAYERLLDQELGTSPGAALHEAMREPVRRPGAVTGTASVEAILESGAAAVAAGATSAGLTSLRSAVALADLASDPRLQVRSRVVLAETLVHSLRGLDEEGLASLYAADEIAVAEQEPTWQAEVRVELGYVDFLRARYDRAERWLAQAVTLSGDEVAIRAKATTYLASVDSDRGDYARAEDGLLSALALAREAADARREVYARSMLGRLRLLRGEIEAAELDLRAAIEQGERDRWLAFLPWPQAFLGELQLSLGRVDDAQALLEQAFARACQLGDPCWEGVSARGLARVAEARGDTAAALGLLTDARARSNRLADPYVWLDVYILDAQCEILVRHGRSDARAGVDAMLRLAGRTSMREMTVRALLHAAALGDAEAADGARLLSSTVDNPQLAAVVPREP